MKCSIPLNAFSSITVHGLVSESRSPYAQMLHRGVVKPGPHVSIEVDYLTRPDGIPSRPASTLPPPGNQHLTLCLGERLGEGRVGSVHTVIVMESGLELPRLVVKVSQRKKSGNMAQEAWFYEELEQLQGVSIPHCYGFFQARIKDEHDVLTWGSDQFEDEDEYKDEYGDEDEDDSEGLVVNEKKYEKEIPGEGRVLSILLLERISGENIPVGEPIASTIRDDVYELFNDMARLGIEPLDIRWSNILSANDDMKTDASGRICPNHGHVHRWRLVDFDLCRKSDGNLYFIEGCNAQWLDNLFKNLVKGRIIEPWDY